MPLALLILALLSWGCVTWGCVAEPAAPESTRTAAGAANAPVVTWKRIASWAGRGDGQTTTFLMERHEWRLNWEAKRATGGGVSRLTVRVHSGDSGRVLDVPLDGVQPGAGTVEMVEEPRVFYLSVEAGDLEWMLSADERIERPRPLGEP